MSARDIEPQNHESSPRHVLLVAVFGTRTCGACSVQVHETMRVFVRHRALLKFMGPQTAISPSQKVLPGRSATRSVYALFSQGNLKEVFRKMLDRYSYQSVVTASEVIHWRIEDIIGGDKRLDFAKPFMPEAFALVEELSFLDHEEKLVLNQIRGNAYLSIFGLVEEFILPFVLDHARPQLNGDDYRVRALLQFAGEEAKHIQLFKRFRQEYEDGFGTHCEVIR